MIRICIVGDIGSGKSYVAKQFGYPVFNADKIVKKIYKKNRKCFKKLKKIFPKYIKFFPIKKVELLQVIIANNNNIKKINKVVHPTVKEEMNKFIKKNSKSKIIILDIPLLLENKINKKKDILVYIEAKKSEVYKRLKKRKNFNFKVYKKLKKLQLPLELKKSKSDYIIKNNYKSNFTKKNVKIVLKEII